jgi:acyl-coenzyme A thioesterase PaaI-like protein
MLHQVRLPRRNRKEATEERSCPFRAGTLFDNIKHVRAPSRVTCSMESIQGETEMNAKAFQDYYPPELSYCYGCGRLNERGHRISSHWDGEETVAFFTPEPYHTAIPGYVYGGLLASLIDCHGTGTAAAAAYRAENRGMDTIPALRFVTASLKVDYLKPTPLGVRLEIRGQLKEISARKVVVAVTISAAGSVCVRGEVVAVQMPATMMPGAGTGGGD